MLFAASLSGDPELAQDIVHEVLVRAQQQWPKIGALDRPHAYVRRMIVNEMTSWRRKWQRIEPRPDAAIDTPAPDLTSTVDRRDFLHRELLKLPFKQRAAVVMRYLEDLPDADIAIVLGCARSTVRAHIHHGLRRLRVDVGVNPARPPHNPVSPASR